MSEQHDGNTGAAHEVHWLYRRGTLPTLWLAGCALLALTNVRNVFVELYAKFGFADKKSPNCQCAWRGPEAEDMT